MLGESERKVTVMPGPCSSLICAPSHHQTIPRCPLHPSVALPVPGCCTTPPKLCHLGGEAGCQADCSIQLALISPSVSGSLSCSVLGDGGNLDTTEQPTGHTQSSAPIHPGRCTQGHTGIRGVTQPSITQHPSLNASVAAEGMCPTGQGTKGPCARAAGLTVHAAIDSGYC